MIDQGYNVLWLKCEGNFQHLSTSKLHCVGKLSLYLYKKMELATEKLWGGAYHRGSVRASHPGAPGSNPVSTRTPLVLIQGSTQIQLVAQALK